MKKILTFFVLLVSKIIGRKNFEKLLIFSAKTIHVNLHIHGLIQNGGLSSFNQHINGEQIFINEILIKILKSETAPVLFDIGANVGDFSLELRNSLPNAEIYAFEPVKATFDLLAENAEGKNIKLFNIGFSNAGGTGKLFNTVNKTNNTIASAYKDVFVEIFDNDDELGVIEFKMETIDSFCVSNNITKIDFLKIDVEGHELSVLQGAAKTLSENTVSVIQFEFNAHNVYSRVFLRDFYLALTNFEFYRMVQDGIIELGAYNHLNEIFSLQNIVAIRKDLCHLIKATSLNLSL